MWLSCTKIHIKPPSSKQIWKHCQVHTVYDKMTSNDTPWWQVQVVLQSTCTWRSNKNIFIINIPACFFFWVCHLCTVSTHTHINVTDLAAWWRSTLFQHPPPTPSPHPWTLVAKDQDWGGRVASSVVGWNAVCMWWLRVQCLIFIVINNVTVHKKSKDTNLPSKISSSGGAIRHRSASSVVENSTKPMLQNKDFVNCMTVASVKRSFASHFWR